MKCAPPFTIPAPAMQASGDSLACEPIGVTYAFGRHDSCALARSSGAHWRGGERFREPAFDGT
jgi:hypothetical protein